jgi:hypothetical protein
MQETTHSPEQGFSTGVSGADTRDVTDQAKDLANQAKYQAKEVAGQAKEKATATLEEAKQGAESKIEEQKRRAADRLSGVAGALRQTGQELGAQDETLAQYADSFAEQVDRMSDYLRERDVSALFTDVRQVAQRHPELFVAGALAAGFLIGRFLKSSGQPGNGGYAYAYDRYDRNSQPTGRYANFQPGDEYVTAGTTQPSAFTSPETARTDWMVEPFSSTQEIPVTGEEHDAV